MKCTPSDSPMILVPSLQLGTGKTAGCPVGKSCLSSVVCLSVRAIAAEGRQARERVQCVARPPCVSTAGEARQRRVYNTKEVLRVDSVPSCKLGPSRTRPRVSGNI